MLLQLEVQSTVEAPSEVLFLTFSDLGQIWSEFSLETILDPLQQLGQIGSESVIELLH